MTRHTIAAVLLLSGMLGCAKKKEEVTAIQTVAIERRDIVVDAEATGVVEPINVIEVKSKASGQITRMPVETGTQVKPGDLLVQVDTRDVQNSYNQSLADLRAAQSKLDISSAQKKRADELNAQRIITSQEHEAAQLDYANAQASLVRARTNLDLAQQRLEDATVRAPVVGTVIEKTVSLGQVITSATGAFGGGTTLLKMADLNQVRMRAMVNETDIGLVQSGQAATVTVDAYPDRPFRGTVEKIEPQAVVQQSVTMFPVLITLSNREGLLKPGMNGEVSILVERKENVLAVPNDAIRNMREAAETAELLGLDPAAVQKQMQTQMAAMGGGGGGMGMGRSRDASGGAVTISRGDVILDPRQRQRGGGRGQLPEVADAQCATVRTALEKYPAARGQLDTLRSRAMSGELDRDAMRAESQKIYSTLGVDPLVARACMMRQRGEAAGTAAQGGQAGGVRVQGGAEAEIGGAPPGGRSRTRPGLVFIKDSASYAPRVVRLGVSNYDFTEVARGLKEGDQVALLSAAALQARRQQQQDRFRGMTGGGVPGMQRQTPAAGAAGAGAGGAGGRPGGGGGRP